MVKNITQKLAQQIVDTVKDVCGRDINFVDTNGIIYANTNESRIGNFHEIGLKVASTGTTIEVYEDDFYYGTKEGVNLPLVHNGVIIAVIGISGKPDEVRKYAHLAIRITKLLIREHEVDAFNRSQKNKENYLIRTIIKDEDINWKHLITELKEFGINENGVFRIMILRLNSRYNITNLPLIEQYINDLFDKCHISLSTFDYPDEYIALIDEATFAQMKPTIQKFATDYSNVLKIGIGNRQTIYQTKESHKFCETALRCAEQNQKSYVTFDELDLDILLGCLDEKSKQTYLNKTVTGLKEEDLHLLAIYYEEGMSLSKTCERLFLHKNTLQYRLERIYRNTGYNPRHFKDAVVLYLGLGMTMH